MACCAGAGRAQSSSDIQALKKRLSELKKTDLAGAEAFCSEKMQNAPPSLKAYLQLNRGTVRVSLNKMSDARRDMEQARRWAAEHPEDTLHAYSLTALGIWFQIDGKSDSAEVYIKKGLDSIHDGLNWTLQADCLELLGLLYATEKQYGKAIEVLKEAYHISSRYKNDRYQSRLKMAMGDIVKSNGAYEQAVEEYLHAEAAALRTDDRGLLSIAQMKLGDISYQMSIEEPDKSRYWLQKSLRYYRQGIELEKEMGRKNIAGIQASEPALTLLRLEGPDGAQIASDASPETGMETDSQQEKILYEQKRSRILMVLLLLIGALFIVGGVFYQRLLRSREKLRRYNAVLETRNTALADQKREIEQLVQNKNQLFSQISYDIRLPLTLAKVPAELLETDYLQELSAGGQYLLQGIIRNLVRLQESIEEIGLLSESESQTGSLQLQTLYLPGFAADIRNSFELIARTKHITFTYKLFPAPGAEYIIIDRNKLEKIILTLILNAFKITPPNGNISLELQTRFLADSSVQLELAVCDNGPAIPEAYLSDISKWHLRGKTDENSVATTLTISNELARRMDARMQATNLRGTGARISLLTRCSPGLAVPTVSITQAARALIPSTAQPSSDALAVVHLVEDNNDTRHLLAFGLQHQFQIVEHATGASFLHYMSQEQPAVKADLLLVDMMLPDITGMELIRKIRREPRFQQLPIIAITGNNLASVRKQIFEEGADILFIKPFNLDELGIRIRSLLARISSRDEQQPADTAAETSVSKAAVSNIDLMLKTVPASQKSWVLKLIGIIEKQISNQELDIASLAREMAVSERQLYRFVKSRTGFSPNQLIHEVRLHSALQLLISAPNLSIAQVSLMVGFENPGYFSVVFKKRFGKNPSDYKNIEAS